MINKCAKLRWVLVIGLYIGGEGWCQKPLEVTPCQLKTDPPTYDHKVVRVTGFVSHGFEDFTLFDPRCPSWPGVWLEYGGKTNSLTVYLGGGKTQRTRPKDLQIEGIVVPLTLNKQFEEFDKAIQPPFHSGQQGAVLRARLVGRFFAGKRLELFEGKPWGGFGHMSCCTLLAIQEVETSDTENHPKLDYGSSPDQPELDKAGCRSRELLSVDQSALLAWQREVDDGKHSWATDDPKRVAFDALSHAGHVNMSSMKNLKLSKEEQGRKLYLYQPDSSRLSYMVVVSRPYWLSFYAHDANRVAWAATAAYESQCDTSNSIQSRPKGGRG